MGKSKEEADYIRKKVSDGTINYLEHEIDGFGIELNQQAPRTMFVHLRLKEADCRKTVYKSLATGNFYIVDLVFIESELYMLSGIITLKDRSNRRFGFM